LQLLKTGLPFAPTLQANKPTLTCRIGCNTRRLKTVPAHSAYQRRETVEMSDHKARHIYFVVLVQYKSLWGWM